MHTVSLIALLVPHITKARRSIFGPNGFVPVRLLDRDRKTGELSPVAASNLRACIAFSASVGNGRCQKFRHFHAPKFRHLERHCCRCCCCVVEEKDSHVVVRFLKLPHLSFVCKASERIAFPWILPESGSTRFTGTTGQSWYYTTRCNSSRNCGISFVDTSLLSRFEMRIRYLVVDIFNRQWLSAGNNLRKMSEFFDMPKKSPGRSNASHHHHHPSSFEFGGRPLAVGAS